MAAWPRTAKAVRRISRVDLVNAATTYVGSRRRVANCTPVTDGFDCVAHEAIGTFLGVGDLTGDRRADVIVSAPWSAFPDAVELGNYGPPMSRAYLVSSPPRSP